MTKETFMKIKRHLQDKANEVMRKKESEYYSTYDVLSSLRKIASFRNRETPQTILDLMSKQLVSLSDMVDDFNECEDFNKDKWDEKFIDILNYTFKLYASIMEYK